MTKARPAGGFRAPWRIYPLGGLAMAIGSLLLLSRVLHLPAAPSSPTHVYDAATFAARPENQLVFPSATVLSLEAAPPRCDPDTFLSQKGHWTQAVVARRLETTATVAEVRAWYAEQLVPKGFVADQGSPILYRNGPDHTVDSFDVRLPANANPVTGGKNIIDVTFSFTTKSGGCDTR